MRRLVAVAALAQLVGSSPVSAKVAASDPPDLTGLDTHVLCYAYLYGEAAKQNYAYALKWCARAAATGNPNDETLLAEIYYLGPEGLADIDKAADWYERAASQGHVHAQFMLYQVYVVSNFHDGAKRLRGLDMLAKAADAGYERAVAARAKLLDDAGTR